MSLADRHLSSRVAAEYGTGGRFGWQSATRSYLMLYKGKLDQIIMCLYVEVICKIQTMYVTNLRSGLEYIVKEQNDLAKDYYKKIAQPVRD